MMEESISESTVFMGGVVIVAVGVAYIKTTYYPNLQR
jgi:hypothetical protein